MHCECLKSTIWYTNFWRSLRVADVSMLLRKLQVAAGTLTDDYTDCYEDVTSKLFTSSRRFHVAMETSSGSRDLDRLRRRLLWRRNSKILVPIICNMKALFQVASNPKWALIVWKLNWRERIRNLGTREIENIAVVLTSHRTSNLAIFQCCFTADNKEMYQNEKHHSRGVPSVQTSLLLLVKYIDLWPCLRHRLPLCRLAATSEAGTVYSRDLIELIMKIFLGGRPSWWLWCKIQTSQK